MRETGFFMPDGFLCYHLSYEENFEFTINPFHFIIEFKAVNSGELNIIGSDYNYNAEIKLRYIITSKLDRRLHVYPIIIFLASR